MGNRYFCRDHHHFCPSVNKEKKVATMQSSDKSHYILAAGIGAAGLGLVAYKFGYMDGMISKIKGASPGQQAAKAAAVAPQATPAQAVQKAAQLSQAATQLATEAKAENNPQKMEHAKKCDYTARIIRYRLGQQAAQAAASQTPSAQVPAQAPAQAPSQVAPVQSAQVPSPQAPMPAQSPSRAPTASSGGLAPSFDVEYPGTTHKMSKMSVTLCRAQESQDPHKLETSTSPSTISWVHTETLSFIMLVVTLLQMPMCIPCKRLDPAFQDP
jgi:hypothetical protein